MTDENPTIPQIVRALTTLSDRQSCDRRALMDEYNEIIKKKERTIAEYDRAAQTRDDQIEAQQRVIEDLLSTLASLRYRASRELSRATDVDAQLVLNAVGREQRLYDLVTAKVTDIRRERASRLSEGKWADGELPDDICECEHARKRHTPRPGLDWPEHQCDDCPGGSERPWKHRFVLAVL